MQYTLPIPRVDEDTRIDIEGFTPKTINPDFISQEIERYFSSYSINSVKAYSSDLRLFWEYINKPIQNTKKADILTFIKKLEEAGYQNSSINRKLAALSKIFQIYISMGLIEHNPVQTLSALGKLYKPVDTAVSLSITKHDVEAVVANARKTISSMIQFLCNTGVRVSEMTHIKLEDVEPFNNSWLRVKLKKTKGGKIRFIFISYELYQTIREAFDNDSIYLFSSRSGKMLSRVNVYKQVRRAFQKYSFREGVHPHELRHFFATTKIRDEKKDYKAVSTYLGHQNVSTTLSIYTTSQLSPEETVII